MLEKVYELLEQQLGVSADELTPDCHIQNDLGADSLDVMEIVSALEDEFDIEVSDEEVESLTTPALIAAYLEGKR
ncbi:MAG: acyl carrier protein [Lachnospiraceae bacterium]|nr:acyl carrier protein [Lachnospiraceae bacterium]MDY5743017.1 acyl carrier protein [Lachnospiraceae bacterium]